MAAVSIADRRSDFSRRMSPMRWSAKTSRLPYAPSSKICSSASDASALQPQADQDDGRGVVVAGLIGAARLPAHLALGLQFPGEFVSDARRQREAAVLPFFRRHDAAAGQRVADDVIVLPVSHLDGAYQPLAEGMIDLQA